MGPIGLLYLILLTSHVLYDKKCSICSNATVHRGGMFGHTTQPEVVSNLQCRGTEFDVSNCTITYSERQCSQGEEIGVSCGEYLWLQFIFILTSF